MHNSSVMQYLWSLFSEFNAGVVTVSVVNSHHQERNGGNLQDVIKTSHKQPEYITLGGRFHAFFLLS